MSFFYALQRQSQKIATSVRQAFRGRLTALDPKNRVQLMQVDGLAGERLQAVEFMQHFGFTSSPPTGTQCIMLPLGGKTVHSIVIATENGDFRIAVNHGETCIYNEWGAKITLKKERIIEVDCDKFIVKAKESVDIQTKQLQASASERASYLSPTLNFESTNEKTATAVMRANIRQTGWHEASGDMLAAGVSLAGHIHKENDHGGYTNRPVAKMQPEKVESEMDSLAVDYSVIPPKPLVIFIGGAADSWTENMRETCEKYCKEPNTEGEKHLFYQDIRYAHHDQKAKLFPLMRHYFYAGKPIVVIGHSWGGATAARLLPIPEHPGGIPIDLVVTLDPVSTIYAKPTSKPSLVKRWLNVYVNPDLADYNISNSVAWAGGRWGYTNAADYNLDINTLSSAYNHADSYRMLFASGVYREVGAVR